MLFPPTIAAAAAAAALAAAAAAAADFLFAAAVAAATFFLCAAVAFGIADGFFFDNAIDDNDVAFFILTTSESELSELLWLSLEERDELELSLDAAVAVATAAAATAAKAALACCFFGGVFCACFLLDAAAAAAYSLDAFGVVFVFFCGVSFGGLGLLAPRLPLLPPLSESLALLSLKMFLNFDIADVTGVFAAVNAFGVGVGAVVDVGVVAAGVDNFGVCPPADDAEGVRLPFDCFAFSVSLERERSPKSSDAEPSSLRTGCFLAAAAAAEAFGVGLAVALFFGATFREADFDFFDFFLTDVSEAEEALLGCDE